jgi:O-antigen ligase
LATVTLTGHSLRFATSDILVLPTLGVLFLWWRNEAIDTPEWRIKHLRLGLVLLTLVIFLSIFNGYLAMGSWSMWAVVNKGVGWLVLISYFLVGGWLTSVASMKNFRPVIRATVLFSALSSLVSFVIYTASRFGVHLSQGETYANERIRGFAENPNAFGIMVVAISFASLVFLEGESKRWRSVYLVAISLSLAGAIMSGSRSALLAILIVGPLIALLRLCPFTTLVRVVIGATLVTILVTFAPNLIQQIATYLSATIKMTPLPPYFLHGGGGLEGSNNHRMSNILTAIDMWKNHPFIGIGLGSFFETASSFQYKAPSVLHNTAVWILVETGLIGLVVFVGFFVWVYGSIFRLHRLVRSDAMLSMGIVLLSTFVAASVGTEILYQRYFWLFAGCVLVSSSANQPRNTC